MGPRAKSSEYYNQRQASCFGVGIYYVDPTTPNVVKSIRVNIFSDILEQDGTAVVRNLRELRKKDFYKRIENDKKQIIVFCDVGMYLSTIENSLNFFYTIKFSRITFSKSICCRLLF